MYRYTVKLLTSVRAAIHFRRALDPGPIRGRLLLEARRLLAVLRYINYHSRANSIAVTRNKSSVTAITNSF